MKKRIIALLMAMIMVFSVAVFASCDKNTADGEESKVSIETLDAKELFKLSVKNTVEDTEDLIPEMLKKPNDLKVASSIKVNKLEVQGEDMTMGNPIAIGFDASFDNDNEAISLNAFAELFGEKPTLGGMITSDALYVTDLLGVNESPILIKLDEMLNMGNIMPDVENGELPSAEGNADAAIAAATKLMDTIAEILESAVEKNITDAAFAKEMKDVTVDGVEFKGSAVVTLTIDKTIATAIINDVIAQITANEEFKALMGEETIDTSEITQALDSFTNIVITNTVSEDAETIALDIAINVNTEEFKGFAVKSTLVGNSCKISAAPIDANGEFIAEEGILNIAYTLDDAGNEKFVISMNENGTSTEFVKVEGTYKDNKREGTFNVNMDGDGISFKYAMEGSLENGKLTLSNLSIAEGGVANEIPMTLTVEYSFTDTKVDTKVSIAANIEGMANIDVSAEVSVEVTDVTLTAPENAVSIDEIDQMEMMGWLSALGEKYPTIFSMISSLMMPEMDFNEDNEF